MGTVEAGQSQSSFSTLLTRERWTEIARILVVGLLTILYWHGFVGLPALVVTVAIGLYLLVKEGVRALFRERKIGTEIFVTIATIIYCDDRP